MRTNIYKLKGSDGKITIEIDRIRGLDMKLKTIRIVTRYEGQEIVFRDLIDMLYAHRLITDNDIMRLRRFYGRITAKAMEQIKWHSFLICSSHNFTARDIEVVDYRLTHLAGFNSNNAKVILSVNDCVDFYLDLQMLKNKETFLQGLKRAIELDLEEVTE